MNTSTVYEPVRSQRENELETKALTPFLALTFVLSWGAIALLILFYDPIIAIFGETTDANPVFILAVYSPGIVGVFMVWRHYSYERPGQHLSPPYVVARSGCLVAVHHPGQA